MNTNRNLTIDILRGSAVLLMLLTHTNGRLSNSSDQFIELITHIGATVCFTIFIFCFGYIHGIKLKNISINRSSQIKRGIELLTIYYLVAVAAEFLITYSLSPAKIASIILFQSFPEYTEFLIPFAILSFILPTFANIYLFITKDLRNLLLFSGILFILATIFVQILPNLSYFNGPISLLISHTTLHTFGILSYSFPYLLGIYFAKNEDFQNYRKVLLITGIIGLITFLLNLFGLSTWNRWPPSIYFILYGITTIFFIIYFAKFLLRIPLISEALLYLSRYSLNIFVFNVVVILALGVLITPNSLNTQFTYIAYPIIIFIIVLFNNLFQSLKTLKKSLK
jgi:hypothetical protein